MLGAYVLTPQLLPWFDNAIAVWANGNQSFAQRSDGKVYPWGQNMLGTLGIEEDDNVEQPNSPIFGLENVADLGNGALHTLAIRDDGAVFSWGWSFEGSLGGGESTINLWAYRLPLLVFIPEE
jgi:alpha-tubulin suppressor-like RCC1 family protein